MVCPKCSSQNVHVMVEQVSAKTKKRGNGCLWGICRAILVCCTFGLWLLIGARVGSEKTKFKSNTVAICQNCANKWIVE